MLPTRAAVAIVATAIAVVLLFSFKTPTQTRPRTPAADVSQASPSANPSPSDSSATRYKDGQYTGQDVLTEFGDVQVRVIIGGGKITDVQTLQMPYDRQRSAQISQYAGPMLHDEVLQAQSAQIDVVTGATYTSQAYAQSLQAALDQAHG